MASLLQNIWKLYAIKVAKWFMLYMPVIVLFYESNGMTVSDVFILQAIYSISIVIIEIPSGYFSDSLGRKNAIIIGTILGFTGFFLYSVGYGFWWFLAAEIILGIGQSFISGTDSALLYDSLLSANRQKDYLKLEGRTTSLGNYAEAVAALLGGWLAGFSLRYVFYGQAFLAFLAIPVAFILVEPTIKSTTKMQKSSLKEIFRIAKYAIIDSKPLRLMILLSSVFGCATLTGAWLVQPYFKLFAIQIEEFGYTWALLNITVGVFAMLAYKIVKPFSKVFSVSMLSIILVTCLFVLSQNTILSVAYLLFIIFYAVRGIATPVFKNYINIHTTSEMRATVLSIRNMIIRIFFSLVSSTVLGYFMNIYSLRTMMAIFAGIISVGLLLVIIAIIRYK